MWNSLPEEVVISTIATLTASVCKVELRNYEHRLMKHMCMYHTQMLDSGMS